MEDTIAQIATPFGEGGIGIIRISGDQAAEILDAVFEPAGGAFGETSGDAAGGTSDAAKGTAVDAASGTSDAASGRRTLRYGHVIGDDGKYIDEVLAVFMKAPKTYTGEDVAEIDCHGGIVPLRKTLALCFSKGARPAERGEFTKRAFLNGRIDLSQAEAVMDVVKAKADKSFDVAMDQLEGKLSKEIKEIRKVLMDLLVELTVNIDYPDEDIEVITYEKLEAGLGKAGEMTETLLASADTGRLVSEGLKVSIIGRPNVGKSSLMNALLREARAIVTDIPGTTRDTIEEELSISGIPVVLTDTAGIRETSDTIEKVGIERSKEAFNAADLIIFMLDGSEGLTEEDRMIASYIPPEKTIVILNKSDLEQKLDEGEVRELLGTKDVKIIKTSLKDGKGTEKVEKLITDLVMEGSVSREESAMVTNARHEHLLREAMGAIRDALDAVNAKEPVEIIEIDVNRAYESLGEIIGESVGDDILEEVFSRFCLGK